MLKSAAARSFNLLEFTPRFQHTAGMEKPIVFLSHSSKDSKTLNRLKSALEKKTHGTIDFFLSSDGESIPFGRNWVAAIQRALERATLTFVFLSPQSVGSGWVHFESGFVFGKGIKVIPLAMPGLDLSKVPPPLNLLQGFNLHSHATLNNVIEVLNREFKTRHDSLFSADEYGEIFIQSLQEHGPDYFGVDPDWVHRISITISADKSFIAALKACFEARHVDHEVAGNLESFETYGLYAKLAYDSQTVDIAVSADVADFAFEMLEEALKMARYTGAIIINIWFASKITKSPFKWQVTAKLYKSLIVLTPKGRFSFKDLEFDLATQRFGGGMLQEVLNCRLLENLREQRLKELVPLLFDLGVLVVADPHMPSIW